jgi:glycosyltransferase involved in cell wall biosynthesis
MRTVSFIIRTKNEEKDIEKTCKLIRGQVGDFLTEIVVVDSGSTDKTVSLAQRFADVVVSILPEDFSWGRALNIGIKASHGEVIFLLSAHCFFYDNACVQNGLNLLEEYDISAIYGKQIGDANKNIFECAELEIEYPDIPIELSKDNQIHGISNACCMLRKEIWINNQYNELLQSSEDYEWYERMTQKGHVFGYTSRIKMVHGHYLSFEYVYKKCYWREYSGRKCQKYVFKGLERNPGYIYLYRFLHSIKNWCRYRSLLAKLNIVCDSSLCFKYVYLCDLAVAKARIDYIRKNNTEIKYEDIMIPQLIQYLDSGGQLNGK